MYNKQMIEAYLRNYATLKSVTGDDEFIVARIDLDTAISKLKQSSPNLYKTIMGVFVYGNPIQDQAKNMKVSKRQINRRLDDGLHLLVMIMNGEVL